MEKENKKAKLSITFWVIFIYTAFFFYTETAWGRLDVLEDMLRGLSYLILAIFAFAHLIYCFRKMKAYAALPLVIILVPFVINAQVNILETTARYKFKWNEKAYQEVVELVNNKQLERSTHRDPSPIFKLITILSGEDYQEFNNEPMEWNDAIVAYKLPKEYKHLTAEGHVFEGYSEGQVRFPQMVGFIDSTAEIVYDSKENCGNFQHCITNNWYWQREY